MKLKFLGTGGGRYVTGEQLRNTAGIAVQTGETQILIDPGPGTLVHAHEMLDKPLETSAVIVSHAHLDHVNDANAVIEMMIEAGDQAGALFANETALRGYGDIEQGITRYHQGLCSRVETLEDDAEYEFEDVKIRSQEMFHSDPKTAGFVLETEEKSIGFWTDTEFSDELLGLYSEVDVMVVYCTRPKGGAVRNHTSVGDIPDIVSETGASTVIVTHFGYSFLQADLEEQKDWLNEELDAKVIFAEDGMEFPGNRSLGDFS